jgi:hypothetical protein
VEQVDARRVDEWVVALYFCNPYSMEGCGEPNFKVDVVMNAKLFAFFPLFHTNACSFNKSNSLLVRYFKVFVH